MELKQEFAPHIRLKDTPKSIMLEKLAVLGVLMIMPIIMYGVHAVFLIISGVAGSVLPEVVHCLIKKKKQTVGDYSAVCAGMICAFLMPPGAPFWLAFTAGAFGSAVAKLPFGRLGRSPFNPAAAGFTFVSAAWGQYFLYYPTVPTRDMPVFGAWQADDVLEFEFDYLAPWQIIAAGKDPGLNAKEFFLGGMKGPLGCTVFILLIVACVYMGIRKLSAWQASASFAVTVMVVSLIFRYKCVPAIMSPVYELLTGWMLFTAVFLVGDISTAPKFASGRVLYGILCGIFAVIFRRVSASQGGEVFAALIMSALSSGIDRFIWFCRERGISFNQLRMRARRAIDRKLKPFED